MRIIKNLCSSVFICGFVLLFAFSSPAQNQPKMSSRILLIPLDDRPPCLQFTVKMGLIGDAEVVTPPRELLGRFTEFGKSDEIIKWLRAQDLKSFDAAIVALDMIAYGGLVASRVHGETTADDALKRVEILRDLKKRQPKMPVYVQNVIMRLAPTGTGDNEFYRAQLAEWAEVSVETDAKSKARTEKLEQAIPAAALADYKKARARDLQINLKAIDLVRDGTIDYLILSQDDAKPKGIHVADRERLIGEIAKQNLSAKIAVQPGADEVSMLLLARAMNKRFKFSPKIKAVYSSEEQANKAMPFEDRPLRETVSYHIKATGAQEVADEKQADLLFYVYASRFENGRAESFANEIQAGMSKIVSLDEGIRQPRFDRGVIVADIDPKGDVQGGDPKFTKELRERLIFTHIYGYASWNTAGNTIGTALPQGVIFALANGKIIDSQNMPTGNSAKVKQSLSQIERIDRAQTWFTIHRLLDDYAYHTPVRAEAKKFAADKKWNTIRFTESQAREVEAFAREKVRGYFDETLYTVSPMAHRPYINLGCSEIKNYDFKLPWDRTFEAEINFDLVCRQFVPERIKIRRLKK
jgi:hypothetical protein